jgi:DNA-binding transcriptional ArsR family regulator
LIVLRFGGADFTRVRFAISPLIEVHTSLTTLDEPAGEELHLPWVAMARSQLERLDLDLLKAVQAAGANAPDFVRPSPRSPVATLEEELDQMLATPSERVRDELRRAYLPASVPPILEPFMDRTRRALTHLADVIREYWRRVLEPHWDRIHSVLEGDILFRARQMADNGLGPPLAELHRQVRIEGDLLIIDNLHEVTCDLGGRGLLLVPSAFTWPRLEAWIDAPCQPTIVYPARGVGLLWEAQTRTTHNCLEELIGRRRAAVLAELDEPRSTTELARRLGLSPPSVSQHLSILRQAAVVRAQRVGRIVLYSRTASGDALLLGADHGRAVPAAVEAGGTGFDN